MPKIITFPDNLPEATDKVKIILCDVANGFNGDQVIDEMHIDLAIHFFDFEGPYGMAKRLGLLVNNSGEDMAIEFMTFVNKIFPNRY